MHGAPEPKRRIMALDVGRKRTGVAVTDPLSIIAAPLCTIPTGHVVPFLRDYNRREPLLKLVIGYPTTLGNAPSEANRYITPVVASIAQVLPELEIVRYDERFTSALAHRAMLEGGLGRLARQDKATVDRVSASLILQSYLEHEEFLRRERRKDE